MEVTKKNQMKALEIETIVCQMNITLDGTNNELGISEKNWIIVASIATKTTKTHTERRIKNKKKNRSSPKWGTISSGKIQLFDVPKGWRIFEEKIVPRFPNLMENIYS